MAKVVDNGSNFIVIEYFRDGRNNIKERRTTVQYEEYNRSLEVIKKIDESEYKDYKIPCGRIASDVCRQIPELREKYFDKFGNFIWALFNGGRNDYFKYYYYSQKCLEWNKVIEYSKRGFTTKLYELRKAKPKDGGIDKWLE